MKDFKLINNLLGWLVFAIATTTYFLTLEPTASWWDCGEYITTAYKLQVGHPPGAPTFQMLGRFFSLFAFGDTSQVALMVNAMSALSSSFTILFLFWTITLLGRKFLPEVPRMSRGQKIALFGSAIVGSLAYTFSDTFWFSAVEGEVYAMSSFFTALVFWIILKWDREADQPGSNRWLILLAYVIGLSIGVHLLNLLAIPAIALVYYYRKYKTSSKGTILTLGISMVLLALILYGIIPWIVDLSARFELIFVNGFGLPFNSGTLIYFALLIAGILFGLRYAYRKGKALLHTGILAFMFLLIGYSSFMMLIIRSNANTPIDQNNPEDAIGLLFYLNREQYGSNPLFYGHYYNAPLDPQNPYTDGSPVYRKDEEQGRYVVVDDRKSSIANYDPRFESVFPRMWSSQKSIHIREYERWGGPGGKPVRITNRNGETEVLNAPTMGQNLRYFFRYQIGHMYWRYFMWNFAGRQNDVQGHGSPHEGNWISGIKFLDQARLGNLDAYPDNWKDNPAHNKFYLLPFLLGLAGLTFHFRKTKQGGLVVLMLYLMTGLAIIVYLNQYPYQPRERDYAYAGSFYAFSIWIGLGVMALYEGLRKIINPTVAATTATALSLLLVPAIMAKEGWDDHDRSGKYSALDFAKAYLSACEPNAILITNGDNDTFPLWYAQEVEGYRTDVRVVNFMLASGSWYIHQLMQKMYDSDPFPLSLTKAQYERGSNDFVPFVKRDNVGRQEVKEIIRFISNDQEFTKVGLSSGKKINYIPTQQLRLTIDSAACVDNGFVPRKFADRIVPFIDWDIKKRNLFKNDLMLLDFLSTFNWDRPLYLASPQAMRDIFDVDQYMHQEGIVYRFMPIRTENYMRGLGGIVDTERCYDLLMGQERWGNLNDPDVTVDRESYRNAAIPRNNFMRLAQSLLREDKKEEAIAVIDRVMELFPNDKILLDIYSYAFAELYIQAGAKDKAEQVALTLAENLRQELAYFDSLRPDQASVFETERRQYVGILSNMRSTAQQQNLEALEAFVTPILAQQGVGSGQ